MAPSLTDTDAVVETRLVHDVQRRATSLLADARRAPARDDALHELRDFVVATLRHHHHREDEDLWPIITSAAPGLGDALAALSAEHEHLDERLDALATVAVGDDGAREEAVAVRDLVHVHLAHEEPVLFPALRRYVPDDTWNGFSSRAVASAPSEGTHLLVALLGEVGSREEVAVIFRHLPDPVQAMLPAARDRGRAALATLR